MTVYRKFKTGDVFYMKMMKIWEHEDYKLIQLQLTKKVLLVLLCGENVITTSFNWDTMIEFIDKNVKLD